MQKTHNVMIEVLALSFLVSCAPAGGPKETSFNNPNLYPAEGNNLANDRGVYLKNPLEDLM